MNKSEILENYYSTLYKWENIISLVKNDDTPEGGYYREFWNPCGFCKVHMCFRDCPLYDSNGSYDCHAMGYILRRLDYHTISNAEAISEISSFIKLIEKIIKEKEDDDVL